MKLSIFLFVGLIFGYSCSEEAVDDALEAKAETITAKCEGDFADSEYNICFQYVEHGEPSEGALKKDCETTTEGGATSQVEGTWTEAASCDLTGGVSSCTSDEHGELTWVTYDAELDDILKEHCEGTYKTL